MARFRSRLPRCPADAGLIRSAARPPYGELPCYARLVFIGVPLTAARLTKSSTGRHCACSKTFGFLQARATGQLTVSRLKMNIQEIKNNIDRFETILKTALRQKYEGHPQAFIDNLQKTNFIYGVDLLSFVDSFELSGYPKERLREATEYCMDFKLQLYYLLEVDMGLYNKLIYPRGYDRSAPHKTPHLLLSRQSLDQSLIVKSRILWERAMNLIYYLDTGKSIENKVSRNKSKRKVFSEFLSRSDKWKFMDQYMSVLSDFEEKYRSPESHKKSVLRAELMGNKVIDSNDLLDLVNYGTNVIWQGILTVLKGKTVMSRFYIEKKADG